MYISLRKRILSNDLDTATLESTSLAEVVQRYAKSSGILFAELLLCTTILLSIAVRSVQVQILR